MLEDRQVRIVPFCYCKLAVTGIEIISHVSGSWNKYIFAIIEAYKLVCCDTFNTNSTFRLL